MQRSDIVQTRVRRRFENNERNGKEFHLLFTTQKNKPTTITDCDFHSRPGKVVLRCANIHRWHTNCHKNQKLRDYDISFSVHTVNYRKQLQKKSTETMQTSKTKFRTKTTIIFICIVICFLASVAFGVFLWIEVFPLFG